MAYYALKPCKPLLQRIYTCARLISNSSAKSRVQRFSTNLSKTLHQEQTVISNIDDSIGLPKYPAGWSKFGWKIKNITNCPELNLSSVVHLHHDFCNAQWLHMENLSDETNAFSVHFKYCSILTSSTLWLFISYPPP